jgi:hypothetical protein
MENHRNSLETTPYRFQEAELLRLQHYRAAIRHGLFTEWPE